MSYLALFIVLLIAFYTGLFGIETWKEKNYPGSIAIFSLALVVIALPVYMLFLRG